MVGYGWQVSQQQQDDQERGHFQVKFDSSLKLKVMFHNAHPGPTGMD